MFDWFYQGLGFIIRFCYSLTNNYAVALLLFALFVKIVLFPLGIKQQKNMVKQARLRPREMAIRKKYAGRTDQKTQQKQQEEIMKLYQEENFNPMGGCLPLLIQLPILFSLYRVITQPLTYLCQFSSETIAAINARITEIISAGESAVTSVAARASAYSAEITSITQMEQIGFERFTDINGFSAEVIPNFELFGGLNLALTPSFTNLSWLLLIPLFTLVFTLLSTRITKKLSYQAPMSQDMANNGTMKIMEYSMPLLSTYICFTVPATIGLYWIYNNVLSILQQVILYKIYPYPKFTQEDYKAAEKAVGADKKTAKKEKDPNKAPVRSLHHIDDDEFEQIYGKKNTSTKKEAPSAPVKEKTETATDAEKAPAADEENKDAPAIKDDRSTKYKKKDDN